MLSQEEIPDYLDAVNSFRFEKKDFIPVYGLYNYARRMIKPETTEEITTTFTTLREARKHDTVLNEVLHLGTAIWPTNREVMGANMRIVLMNIAMVVYNVYLPLLITLKILENNS